MAPLRMNATVSDGRITVIFSHKTSATNYDRYLQCLDDSFYEKQNCELAESGDRISMDLPTNITTEPSGRLKDVNLVFADAEEALAWEKKMILWKQRLPEANRRMLSRDLTVEHFSDEIIRAGRQSAEGLFVPTSIAPTNFDLTSMLPAQPLVRDHADTSSLIFGTFFSKAKK